MRNEMIYKAERPIQKSNLLKHSITALLLTNAALVLPESANAATAYDLSCKSCHGAIAATGGTPGVLNKGPALPKTLSTLTGQGIQDKIISVTDMQSLDGLFTIAELQAIADMIIAGTGTPPTAVPPTAVPPTTPPTADVWSRQPGVLGKNNSDAAATDIYAVTCPVGTRRFIARVKDVNPPVNPAEISIQISATRGGQLVSSTSVTDPIETDALFSANTALPNSVNLSLRPVLLNLTVNKSATTTTCDASDDSCDQPNAGPENYVAMFSCRDATNATLTGVTWRRTQNQ